MDSYGKWCIRRGTFTFGHSFWARFSAGLKLYISHQLTCSYVRLFFLKTVNVLEVSWS